MKIRLSRSWSILFLTVPGASRSLFPLFLVLAFGFSSLSSRAQTTGINEDSRLVIPLTGGKLVEWYGRSGYTYFLQASDENTPLTKWSWAPIIESGNDEPISHEIIGTPEKGFFRLQFTDLPVPAGLTIDTADFDLDGISNVDEVIPPIPLLPTDPLNADTDLDGLPDGWERVHGLDPNDSTDAVNPFPGSPLTNLEAFNAGVQASPNASPSNKDGDALDNPLDAAPDDPVIDWERPSYEAFVAVEMPQGYLSSFDDFSFECLELTDDFDVLLAGGGLTAAGPPSYQTIGGIWKLDEENLVPVSGPDFPYVDPDWGPLVRESRSPVGMVGSSVLYNASATVVATGGGVDDQFGGAILAPGNGVGASFWEQLVGQGVSCHRVNPVGGDRYGKAIIFLEGMYGGSQYHSEVWSMSLDPTSGNPTISKICDTPGNSKNPVDVTKGGWVSAFDKVRTPTGGILTAPAIDGSEELWTEDLPNGRLIISRLASATKVFLLDAQQKFVNCEKNTLKDQQIKAATQWGAFLNTANELWTRDRSSESQATSWIPLEDWAGQTIADLVTAGWSLKLASSNPTGGMVIELTKDASKPKVFCLLPIELKIWNGQDAADAVSEDKKYSVGSFTVANLNDTDGDGGANHTPDKDDNEVTGEKDLMRLNAAAHAGIPGKIKITVKSGKDRIKLWETKEKTTAIPLNGDGAVFFDIPEGGLDRTLWIEATAASGAVRDIEIWEGYQDAQGNLQDGLDKVRATAIWVSHKETKNKAADAMWGDASQELRDRVVNDEMTPFGESFDRGFAAGQQTIGLQFEVFPHGLVSEASIRFDVSRQVNYQYWVKNEANVFVDADNEAWPSIDIANDDPNNDFEDNIPENNYLFSIDTPSLPFNIVAPEPVAQQNFREFVRVWFKEDKLEGNNDDGSRCSDKYDWRSFYWWIHTPSAQDPGYNAYKRKPGAPENSNKIGPGHGTIAQPTP